MLIVCWDIFDAPVLEGTVLQNREAFASIENARVFRIRNLTAGTPAFRIQKTEDGGTTWTNLALHDGTVEITLAAAGAAGDIAVERMESLHPLRVRASGGGADRDLEISLERNYRDTTHVWTSALL